MTRRVLHVLSQRPGRTGSGVTLDALVRHAAERGWEQAVAIGTPADDPRPRVGGLADRHVEPLLFGTSTLNFPLPGMSDIMPYPSTRMRDLTDAQVAAYLDAWRLHLSRMLERFQPDVIHAHHLWLLASIVKDVAPNVPVVVHSHATGLRQMTLCPHLATEVRRGCARADGFLALTHDLGRQIHEALGVPTTRVAVVGAGYRDELFHSRDRDESTRGHLLYAGKFARAKGLPWLLDALEAHWASGGVGTLHVAGGGGGGEAPALEARMRALAPRVVLHGHLDQAALADLMRRVALFVLPSFYEGLPLVLVEAAASGCRLVATNLPTVEEELAPVLGNALEGVPLPRRTAVDEPVPADLERFTSDLAGALRRGLAAGPLTNAPRGLETFTWAAVFERVEAVWDGLLAGPSAQGP